MEEAAAVVVGGGHVGGVGGDGVVGGRLGAHGGGGEAGAQRAGALHLEAVGQAAAHRGVLERRRLLVVGAAGGGGRGGAAAAGAGVGRDLLGRRGREAEEVGAGVRGRRERGGRGAGGRAAGRVDGEGAGGRAGRRRVQGPLGEGADRPRVVVVGRRRERRLAAVQPGQAGAVEQVGPAHLAPGQAGCGREGRKERRKAKRASGEQGKGPTPPPSSESPSAGPSVDRCPGLGERLSRQRGRALVGAEGTGEAQPGRPASDLEGKPGRRRPRSLPRLGRFPSAPRGKPGLIHACWAHGLQP